MASGEDMLRRVPFGNPDLARRNLSSLKARLEKGAASALLSLLQDSPDPDGALQYLDRFSANGALPSGSRLNALLAIFAHSQFLSETLFQQPDLLDWAFESGQLHRVLREDELRAALGSFPPGKHDRAAVVDEFARFKRRHLLRIVLRDLLRLATLAEVALELSNLADTLLDAGLERVRQELAPVHGRQCEFVVIALGKLGGQELNYSSDIDLLYLFGGSGQTEGPQRITNREFSIQVAGQLTALLSTATPHGFCYRVDLRLRPEGRLGEMALPLAAALDYYERRARDWELQMLIKARPAAGDLALGRRFLDAVEPLIYKTTTDFSAVESVSETRQRIHEKLRRRAPAGLNIKLTRGGIRDVEFLVQCLQRLHGGRDLWVRHGGTRFALDRLRDKGYLAARDYARLNAAYHFLRVLEHRLQMEHDRQLHTLPQDPRVLEILARKMRLQPPSGPALIEQTERHLAEVAGIYDRVIHGPGPPSPPAQDSPTLFRLEMENLETDAVWSRQAQIRFLEKRSPELAARIAAAPLSRGRPLFEHFLAKVISMPELIETLEQAPALIDPAADLFEHSPFFAESLIRNPEEIRELASATAAPPPEPQPTLFPEAPEAPGPLRARDHPELDHLLQTQAPVTDKLSWLRRFFRHRMLQIQGESVCRRDSIFSTLDKTTRIADWIVEAAYHIALDEVARGQPARISSPMHAVALGRLGMREFDIGSDADLVFIVPDEAQGDMPFWTRVAERLIDVLTSYTGEGVIFSVDTRLRPLGREGELVQTESRYKQYFAEQAQAWEAITYMKSRCVAGDVEKGTAFLQDLQNVDWRRYGQSGSLAALLSGMRRKLEKEQGAEQPLKAGRGGYYDIDFVLMFLRLRGAGIFYPSLNTPERIEVIERMGLLSREHADFLRAAAVFYRSLDHALRVSTGRSHGALPKARSQVAILTELVRRWTPASLHTQPIDELLAEMRRRTREVFDQIFGVD